MLVMKQSSANSTREYTKNKSYALNLKKDTVYAQLASDSEPMWLTDMYIKHPGKIIIAGFLFLIIATVLAFLLGYFELSKNTQRDYLIWSD